MTKSSCDRYTLALIDYALGAPAEAGLELHLAHCDACRSRLDEERRLAGAIDGGLVAGLDVSPRLDFERRVRQRITTVASRAQAIGLLAAGTGVAVALAAVIVVVVVRPGTDTASSAPPTATITEHAAPLPSADGPPRVDPPVVETPGVSKARSRPSAPRRREPEPAVLVDTRDIEALRRYAGRATLPVPASAVLATEPPTAFQSGEIPRLHDLPRLSVSDVEPPKPLDRLAAGGDV